MRERKIILKQLEKLTKIVEKTAVDPSVKVPETVTKVFMLRLGCCAYTIFVFMELVIIVIKCDDNDTEP